MLGARTRKRFTALPLCSVLASELHPAVSATNMAIPDVRLAHLGAGCNRVVNALDWGAAGLLAYAAHNAVMIYDPEVRRRRWRRRRVAAAMLGSRRARSTPSMPPPLLCALPPFACSSHLPHHPPRKHA